MRISLKDLLGIVAFSAVLAWCVSWAGVDNGMFWFAVVGSAVLSGNFVTLARDKDLRSWAPLVPLPLLLCCIVPFASLSLIVNGILLLGAGIFCVCRPPLTVRTLSIVVMVCAAVSWVAGVYPGIAESRQLAALRQEFPLQPLDERLDYERRRPEANNTPSNLHQEVSTELNDWENHLAWSGYREAQFRKIHDRQYELFVRAIGFGVTRMMRPWPDSLRRPPLGDIAFDAVSTSEDEITRNDWQAFENSGTSTEPEHLHVASRNDFVDPDGFGAVVAPRQVVGFVQHGFHHPPRDAMTNPQTWTVGRLELVSLLKFDEPRVYVLDHLPRMDQLSSDDVPTRPLDMFETEALRKLWTDQDVVVSRADDQYRMLGSLRAASPCLDCHDVVRGELLGAFSYVLQVVVTDNTGATGAGE